VLNVLSGRVCIAAFVGSSSSSKKSRCTIVSVATRFLALLHSAASCLVVIEQQRFGRTRWVNSKQNQL
jgi:hypothetical protein